MKFFFKHARYYMVILVFYLTLNLVHDYGAYAQDIKFNHITPDQGVGFGNLWAILEDQEGFMWFGTEDGLIKYDGYNLTNYKYDKSDSTTISANFVVTLLEDRFGQLWVGTFGGGLNRYERNKDSFTRFVHDEDNPASIPHNRIKTLLESKDGKIWVGTEGAGVVTFDPDPANSGNIQFEKLNHPQLDTNDPNIFMIRSLAEHPSGSVYIGSLSGITILDKNRENLIQLRQGNTYPNILSSNQILEVFIDSRERIWIGTLDAGLDLYLPRDQKVVNYSPSESENTLQHPEIETIAEDQLGNLWIGSDNGLSKMNASDKPVPSNQFTNFSHHTLNESSLLSNSIKIAFVDNRNSLWVGSYYGGINVYNPNLYKFTTMKNRPWMAGSISHDNVTAFAEDQNGDLWIGMDGGGINLLRGASKSIFSEKYENIIVRRSRNSPPETKTKTMAFDHEGNLWIGFWVGGLHKFNPKTGQSIYFGPDDKSNSGLLGIRILDLAVDSSDNMWVATFDQGISYFDKSTGKFKNYQPGNQGAGSTQGERFNSIIIDTKGRVWAGGDLGGVNLYNEKSDLFEAIDVGEVLNTQISILNIFERANGDICIGTLATGLIIYNPDTGQIVNFSEESGFPSNVIHATLEDSSENLWLGTNQGLVKLNPEDSSFTGYTQIDGLQGNQFNNGSCLDLSNGQLIFGGIKGWNGFYPENISKGETSEKIVYTNMWINGELVRLSEPDAILSTHLNANNPVKLKHNQKSFTVEFAILDYDFSNLNRYAYYLEGFDTDWHYINTDRKAVFNNMAPGDYKLHVKATNHDGFWVEKPEALMINVIPAWWQTNIFRYSLVIILVLLAYIIFRIRINLLIRQSRKLESIVQLRTQEIHDKNLELHDKNSEIQAQNEELFAQNEQISMQREQLEKAQVKLSKANENLEEIVKARTAKLETTINQLDKTVTELDRFVYSASHDLSAPLKSLKGLIEILKTEREPELIHDCITHMIKSVESLEEVIKNLVDYSKNAHMEVEKSPVNCKEIIDKVINELKYWPEAEKIHYENLVKSEIIHTDLNRLKIILHNLIGNAIKYADLDKDKSYVKLECNTENNHWELKVSDNGIGIAKDHLRKIFDMYYRASEKSTGSGLGLFIVKESVNKLNGKIKVDSVVEEGSTFTIKLPLK